MVAFRLTLLADHDLAAIEDYIARDNPVMAAKTVAILHDKCRFLAQNPRLFRVQSHFLNLRKYAVGNYLIFYRILGRDIEIVRILHSARDIKNLLPPEL